MLFVTKKRMINFINKNINEIKLLLGLSKIQLSSDQIIKQILNKKYPNIKHFYTDITDGFRKEHKTYIDIQSVTTKTYEEIETIIDTVISNLDTNVSFYYTLDKKEVIIDMENIEIKTEPVVIPTDVIPEVKPIVIEPVVTETKPIEPVIKLEDVLSRHALEIKEKNELIEKLNNDILEMTNKNVTFGDVKPVMTGKKDASQYTSFDDLVSQYIKK